VKTPSPGWSRRIGVVEIDLAGTAWGSTTAGATAAGVRHRHPLSRRGRVRQSRRPVTQTNLLGAARMVEALKATGSRRTSCTSRRIRGWHAAGSCARKLRSTLA